MYRTRLGITPWALDDALRHALKEFIHVPPRHIRETPCAGAAFLNGFDNGKEITPPDLALPDDYVLESALMTSGLLVIADVEEAWTTENLANVGYDFRAYPAVLVRTEL